LPWFIALVEGGPIDLAEASSRLEIPPTREKLGFVSNRCVLATTEELAAEAAVADALTELREKGVEILPSMPKPIVSEIRLATWRQRRRKWRGFAFYPWDDEVQAT
jgi:hypothetical protein